MDSFCFIYYLGSLRMCACVCECAIISFTEHSQWLQRIFSIILHLSPILLSFICFLWHLFSLLVNIWYFGFYQFWYAMMGSCGLFSLFVYVTTACGDLKLWRCDLWFIYLLYYVPACLLSCILSKQHHFYFHYTEINIKSQYWKFC